MESDLHLEYEKDKYTVDELGHIAFLSYDQWFKRHSKKIKQELNDEKITK